MNSPVENTVVVAKAPRAPTLAAKYSKFMAFGYWITSQLVEKAILTEAQRDSVFENLAMFQSLDEQVAFYEGFLKTSCGPSTKAIKKMVAAKNKPPKAPRAKKTKAVAAEKQDDLIAKLIADANDGGVAEGAPQEGPVAKKKAASKKSKKTEVPAAEGTSEPVAPVEGAVAEALPKKKAAPKKSKKTEAATEGSDAPVTEGSDAPVTEGSTDVATADVVTADALPKKKAAPKKSKKTETVATEAPAPVDVTEVLPKKKAAPKKSKKTEAEPVVAAPVEVTEVEVSAEDGADEDIIQTRVVAIADKEYLIDSQNNLYTIQEPHDNIGSYDPASGNVSFLPSYTATASC